jgi:hypothetical protein
VDVPGVRPARRDRREHGEDDEVGDHACRNTLVYRLDKVDRLLGRSRRDHRAMLSLYLACVADQLEGPDVTAR